mmetsp:Transcript_72604/g.193655  ORF Transcript_72604/g.193655 Transcript_72604/m.193655 type:complete len:83 (-) Transcript_72604:56-304(-)
MARWCVAVLAPDSLHGGVQDGDGNCAMAAKLKRFAAERFTEANGGSGTSRRRGTQATTLDGCAAEAVLTQADCDARSEKGVA